MSIKKPYVSLVEFLEINENKKVSSILEEIKLMCESKKTASTVIRDSNGEVLAVFCYYHKQWELVADVEYGSKANTQSGLNTMCKIGVSKWTKAQRDAKKANEELLTSVASGDILPNDIKAHQVDIETKRLDMDTIDMPQGFANEEDLHNFGL